MRRAACEPSLHTHDPLPAPSESQPNTRPCQQCVVRAHHTCVSVAYPRGELLAPERPSAPPPTHAACCTRCSLPAPPRRSADERACAAAAGACLFPTGGPCVLGGGQASREHSPRTFKTANQQSSCRPITHGALYARATNSHTHFVGCYGLFFSGPSTERAPRLAPNRSTALQRAWPTRSSARGCPCPRNAPTPPAHVTCATDPLPPPAPFAAPPLFARVCAPPRVRQTQSPVPLPRPPSSLAASKTRQSEFP